MAGALVPLSWDFKDEGYERTIAKSKSDNVREESIIWKRDIRGVSRTFAVASHPDSMH
jgi:hypothetical protein